MDVNSVSPAVEAVLSIRKDLAGFQRTLGKQAFRAALRAACEATLWSQAPDLSVVHEYLIDRGFRIGDGVKRNGKLLNGKRLNGKRVSGAMNGKRASMKALRFYQPKGLS
jgi:hypothetical protein